MIAALVWEWVTDALVKWVVACAILAFVAWWVDRRARLAEARLWESRLVVLRAMVVACRCGANNGPVVATAQVPAQREAS